MTGALDRPVHITLFPTLAADQRESMFLPLSEFADRLRDDRAPGKADLKLFSPCSYGNARTIAKSLRHDANIREAFCIIGDYDGEVIAFDDAVTAARHAGVAMILVTTASHTPDKPRWRAIAPLAMPLHKNGSLAEHARLTARLAGIFPGIISAESWVRSQSWFIGTITDAPDHRLERIDGDYIDERADLDATAQPKPTPAPKAAAQAKRANSPPAALPPLDDPDRPADIDDALLAIARGEGSHAALVYLCGKFAVAGVPIEQAEATLLGAADQRPDGKRDAGWHKMRRDIPRTLSQIYDKEASAQARLNVIIASATKRGNGAGNGGALSVAAPASSAGGGVPPPPGSGPAPGAPPPPPQPGVAAQAAVRGMIRDKRPRYAGIVANVITTLRDMPALAGCVAYDEMALRAVLCRALPGEAPITKPRPWTDADTTRLQDFLQRHAEMARVSRSTVDQGVDAVARDHKFHPVRDYLAGLKWDGRRRLNTWLSRYLGVRWSRYAAKTGRWWLIGLVARVQQPGCRADYMLILEGPQGIEKSQVGVVLCSPWVSDQPLDIRGDSRAASQHLRGRWLCEISELAFFKQADIENLKAFLTRPIERYLPRYAQREVEEPRQGGFFGTTNRNSGYLHDPTGGRRVWPQRTDKIDIAALTRDRDQLWAEAAAGFHAGEHWWPPRDFEESNIQPEQAERYDADAWMELVNDELKRLVDRTANERTTWARCLSPNPPSRERTPLRCKFGRPRWSIPTSPRPPLWRATSTSPTSLECGKSYSFWAGHRVGEGQTASAGGGNQHHDYCQHRQRPSDH